MNRRFPATLALCLLLFLKGTFAASPDIAPSAIEREFASTSAPLFKEFCFQCHNDKKMKGRLSLEHLTSSPDFAALFKTWEKVITKLEDKEMPPEDEDQPTDAQRRKLISSVRDALDSFIRQHSGDPGRVALRRLTSAEYAYSIQDLTGLDLGLERTFISDAVGAEGFSNVGDVQFVQDSTLEHYLEAAKIVASHAVIGAGPLFFDPDPGTTGQELSAVRRIQKIYKDHGFRIASSEGGLTFGLEHYPKAFYAAWRFQHRAALGLKDATLAQIAHEEGLDAPFVEYIWKTLRDSSLAFPSSEITAAWQKLPAPEQGDPTAAQKGRAESDKLGNLLDTWQTSLAENTGDAEVATILTETSFRPSLTNSFRVRLGWPRGITNGTFRLTVNPLVSAPGKKTMVLWHEPSLRFIRTNQLGLGTNTAKLPRGSLRAAVTDASANLLQFGRAPDGRTIGTNDFVTTGSADLQIDFAIPPGAAAASLSLDAQLLVGEAEDSVVHCIVSHHLSEGATAAAIDTFSMVLANPDGADISHFKAGVAEFARTFPQISHREADPADRDPIPAPFNNNYNNLERNEFHTTLKYFRDDRFLTEHIVESGTRRELDQAWADLLTAFDYHNLFIRFIARKYQLGLTNVNVANLTAAQIYELPEEPRALIKPLYDQYLAARKAVDVAEPGHIDDALHFAQLAWRRPLADSEKERLRSFYASFRKDLDHPAALRALLARILVSPAFLYRVEPLPQNVASSGGRIALSDRELASRLSYFLWSSVPDAELTRAADAGELSKPDQLAQQAQRMLRDPKARRFATEFFGQWFGFYRFDGYRGVDTTRFTEFTDELKDSMYDEAVSFFDYIVRENRPVHEILFADYDFLNRDLAAHYRVNATAPTNTLARIDGVNQFHRGGLLRLGAVLTSTSAPLRTSAVKRGDWILRRVLGKSVPPPPGDAGSIPPDDVLADGKTVRQRLEAHRRNPSCVNCHSRIDALGFALEHFDSVGRWRDTYRDRQTIDASGKLNDGTEISEFEGLNSYLLANEALFNRTLCAKLLGFALGRSELISDRPLLDQMTAGLKTDNRFSTLVTQIVTSQQFRFRRTPEMAGL